MLSHKAKYTSELVDDLELLGINATETYSKLLGFKTDEGPERLTNLNQCSMELRVLLNRFESVQEPIEQIMALFKAQASSSGHNVAKKLRREASDP